jgi:hypothetical protein
VLRAGGAGHGASGAGAGGGAQGEGGKSGRGEEAHEWLVDALLEHLAGVCV